MNTEYQLVCCQFDTCMYMILYFFFYFFFFTISSACVLHSVASASWLPHKCAILHLLSLGNSRLRGVQQLATIRECGLLSQEEALPFPRKGPALL